MKHKIYTIICTVFLLISLTMTAYAAKPVSIERKTVNGTEYIVKIFTITQNISAESLIEADFEENGYSFKYTNAEKKENISESSKTVTETKTIETKTNKSADILKLLDSSISYGENGYKGTLALDTASINTQASGYAHKDTPIYKTKEYTGFIYADPSFVPGSITDNGVTLTLTNIDWVVMATALAGDTLIPTEYKAVASYSGSQRTIYATGYTTTAKYAGIVTKKTIDSVTYTITYTGTFIPIPTTAEPPATEPETTEINTVEETTEPETQDDENGDGGFHNRLSKLLGIIAAALLIAGAAAGFIIFIYPKLKNNMGKKSKINASVYNLVNDQYILLGTQPLDRVQPKINLDEYGGAVKTPEFGFVLDKKTSETLFGKIIGVKYGDETLTHVITEIANEYKFILVFNEENDNANET